MGPETGVKPSGHTQDGFPLAGKHLNEQLWWPGAHGLLSGLREEMKIEVTYRPLKYYRTLKSSRLFRTSTYQYIKYTRPSQSNLIDDRTNRPDRTQTD